MNWDAQQEAINRSLTHDNPQVRAMLARSSNCSVEQLTRLATDPDEDVKCAVASNPKTDPAVISQLAYSASNSVRAGAAYNPATPLPILTMLARDDCSAVRGIVMNNPSSPVSLIVSFAYDEDCLVRLDLPAHPLFPEVARRLLEHEGALTEDLPDEWIIRLFEVSFDLSCDCDFHSTPVFTPPRQPRFETGNLNPF